MRPLSSADTFWLRAGSRENPMVVSGFLALEGHLGLEKLKTEVERTLLPISRFRSPVLDTGGRPRWGEAAFDPDLHFEVRALPDPGGELGLAALMSELVAEPLPADRPLWKMYLVHGLDGGSVVIPRVHHCVADGLALVGLLLSMTAPLAGPPQAPSPSTLERAWAGLLRRRRRLPRLPPLRAAGAALGDAITKVSLLPPQDHPAFKGRLGTDKVVAWSAPMALDPIKAMGRAVNGKVNDVLLALAAGALRRWLEARGTPLEAGEALRATVPINLRPMDQVVELGNRIGMVFVHLPVAVRGVRARLDAVKAEMDAIKGSAEAPVTFGLMRALGFTSPEVEDALLDVFSRKASLVLSNVPGPSARLRFAGQPLRRLMFWVPQSGSISLGLSIISYAGEVMLGACADRGLFPDLGELSEAVHAEHDHMAEVLGA